MTSQDEKIPLWRGTLEKPKNYPSAANFLTSMQDNLRLARTKLQQAAERANFNEDKKRSHRFSIKENVFLFKFH